MMATDFEPTIGPFIEAKVFGSREHIERWFPFVLVANKTTHLRFETEDQRAVFKAQDDKNRETSRFALLEYPAGESRTKGVQK